MSKSFDRYRAEIAEEYARARHGVNADYLLKPSPARLRNLCLILHDEGLNAVDIEIIRRFFSSGKDGDLGSAIRHCDTDKLRPIQRFFLGQSELSPMESVNLSALLVNFEPRPFLKYKGNEPLAKPESGQKQKPDTEFTPHRQKLKHRYRSSIIAGICVAVASIFGIKLTFFRKDLHCMKWENDHFVEVNCNAERQSWDHIETIDAQRLQNFRKIAVCDTTTFFRNGRPVIWYDKSGEDYEFFTAPGLDPVDGHTVRPITSYIIQRHVPTCK